MSKSQRIAEILVRHGLLAEGHLADALEAQLVYGGRVGTNLVELGFVPLDDVGRCLVIQSGLAQATSELLSTADAKALELLSGESCARLHVLPMSIEGDTLHLAMMDPSNPELTERLADHLNRQIKPYIVPELRLLYYLERWYGIDRPKRFLRVPDGGEATSYRRRYLAATIETGGGTPSPARSSSSPSTNPVTGLPANPTGQPPAVLIEDNPRRATRTGFTAVSAAPGATTPPGGEERGSERQAVAAREGPGSGGTEGAAPDLAPQEEGAVLFDGQAGEILLAREGRFSGLTGLPAHLRRSLKEMESAKTGQAIARALVTRLYPQSTVSVLFWVRGTLAIGCCAEGTGASLRKLAQMVIPLDAPGLLQRAYRERRAVRLQATEDPTQAWVAEYLGAAEPAEVCVAPVVLGRKVVNLLCLQASASLPESVGDDLGVLTHAASAAYRNLRERLLAPVPRR